MAGLRNFVSSPAAKVVLSAALLLVLLWKTNLAELTDAVKGADPSWVMAAFIGYLASQIVSAIRWTMLSRPLGFDEPLSHFLGSYFTGMYMNLFAPSTVAGDVGRALYLAGAQKRKALAFTTVIADRGLGFIVLSWIGALAVLTHPEYHVPRPVYYGAWVIPPGTLLGWLFGPPLAARLLAPGNSWRRMVEHDLARYWRDFRLLGETSMVAALFHCMQVTTQVLLAWALGLHVPLAFFFVFVPVVNILGMLPISFSGIGIREGGYWYFLAQLGVARSAAVALGLLSSLIVLATGVAGGLVFLFWRGPQPVTERAEAANDLS